MAVSIDCRSDELSDESRSHRAIRLHSAALHHSTSVHSRQIIAAARRPGDHPRALGSPGRQIMTHLRASGVSDCRARRAGQVDDAVAGQGPSVGTLTGRRRPKRTIWILTGLDDDKRATRGRRRASCGTTEGRLVRRTIDRRLTPGHAQHLSTVVDSVSPP